MEWKHILKWSLVIGAFLWVADYELVAYMIYYPHYAFLGICIFSFIPFVALAIISGLWGWLKPFFKKE